MCQTKCITLKKMENEMFCYVCKDGKFVKDVNGSTEYIYIRVGK